jgi:hypothetical protein
MDGLQFAVALAAQWLIKRELDEQRFAMDGASCSHFIGSKLKELFLMQKLLKNISAGSN